VRALLNDAANRAIDYIENLPNRRVAPADAAVSRVAEFVEPLPEKGTDPAAILAQLDDIGSAASVAMAGPRFFGFVIGGSLPSSTAANWLATAWDQNTTMHRITPAVSTLEQVALDWIIDMLGLPRGAGGGFVTGATVANFTALAAARHSVLEAAGWDVEADGLFGAPEITVLVGEEAHPTLTKSLGLLGLGRNRVITVPVDSQGRMRANRLPRIDGPTIICTQVGNINTGACDPVASVCEHARPASAWVHVDGAFGLWLAASPTRKDFVDGIGLADSWATDAHKWLNVPYDSGLAIVRDPATLRAAMAITAAYLQMDPSVRNPADYTPELSRRARGVEVWAALKELGREGVAAMIDRDCDLAKRFADGFREAGYEVLNDVVMNQVMISFGEAQTTESVIRAIQEDGTCWCGITQWQGRTAMRISVCNWSTSAEDVERSLEAMIRIAGQITTAGRE